jgi:cytochrome c oxidase subunit I+III
MLVVLHGLAGGWDELLIAALAFGVLWIAVKLAGRKPAGEDAESVADESAAVEAAQEPAEPVQTPAPGFTNATNATNATKATKATQATQATQATNVTNTTRTTNTTKAD